MAWIKRGLIHNTDGSKDWSRSHAAVPTVDAIDETTWRIYFSTRDANNRSFPSYIDVEAGNPGNIRYVHNRPLLQLGKTGSFDYCGIMPCWSIDHQGAKYLYYIGWGRKGQLPYHNRIGLALSQDNGRTFEKYSEQPLFECTDLEPHLNATVSMLIEDGLWKCWYLSGTGWKKINGRLEPFYNVKYAESDDGILWRRNGQVAIDFKSPSEGGIARPCVYREGNQYRMWYCYRDAADYRTDPRRSYRIGYAESLNGKDWNRLDHKAEIDISESGWDSMMLAYPYVLDHHGRKFLFYNGNGFGASGFGYAVYE